MCRLVHESNCHRDISGSSRSADNSTQNSTGKCGPNVTSQVAEGGHDVTSDITSNFWGGWT
jgi:hypothetical protein